MVSHYHQCSIADGNGAASTVCLVVIELFKSIHYLWIPKVAKGTTKRVVGTLLGEAWATKTAFDILDDGIIYMKPPGQQSGTFFFETNPMIA